MAMVAERLADINLAEYFPKKLGWIEVRRPLSYFSHGLTIPGTPIKCMDRDFGMTPQGYDPREVPASTAWPGASDGINPYMAGETLEERAIDGAKRIRKVGYLAASHGDYLVGDDGCAFRNALMKGQFPGLPSMTMAEYQALMTKTNTHKARLHRPGKDREVEPEGFVLNDHIGVYILPDGGRYYPIETWLGREIKIPYEVFLPMIAKAGELLLHGASKRLFIATD